MSNLKDGKKPLSQKPKASSVDDFEFGNKLYVEPSLKAEAFEKGLELRFISAKKLYENSGYHENRWEPYLVARGTHGTLASNFKFGNDPDGVFRLGEGATAALMIRKHLEEKAARYSPDAHKKEAENLDQAMRKAGIGNAIIGDENEEK